MFVWRLQLYLMFRWGTATLFNVQMGDNNSYCKCRTGYSKLTDKLPTVCIQSNTLDKLLDFLDRNLSFFRGEFVGVLVWAFSLILHVTSEFSAKTFFILVETVLYRPKNHFTLLSL
jgi:hypothetical protein